MKLALLLPTSLPIRMALLLFYHHCCFWKHSCFNCHHCGFAYAHDVIVFTAISMVSIFVTVAAIGATTIDHFVTVAVSNCNHCCAFHFCWCFCNFLCQHCQFSPLLLPSPLLHLLPMLFLFLSILQLPLPFYWCHCWQHCCLCQCHFHCNWNCNYYWCILLQWVWMDCRNSNKLQQLGMACNCCLFEICNLSAMRLIQFLCPNHLH